MPLAPRGERNRRLPKGGNDLRLEGCLERAAGGFPGLSSRSRERAETYQPYGGRESPVGGIPRETRLNQYANKNQSAPNIPREEGGKEGKRRVQAS